MVLPRLTPNQIEHIAHIMGDTNNGFTGFEIGHFLAQCHMDDPNPGLTKMGSSVQCLLLCGKWK